MRSLVPLPCLPVVLLGCDLLIFQWLFQNIFRISIGKDLHTIVGQKPAEVHVESLLIMGLPGDNFSFFRLLHSLDKLGDMFLVGLVPVCFMLITGVSAYDGSTMSKP